MYQIKRGDEVLIQNREIDYIITSIMVRHLYETRGISSIKDLISEYLNPIAAKYGLTIEKVEDVSD